MTFDKKAYQKKYAAEWYKKNKADVLKRIKRNNKGYIIRNDEFVREIKQQNPCTDCRKVLSTLCYGL